MEEDRAIADLGPDVVASELDAEEVTIPKAPKRRFIGRRAADAKAAAAQTLGELKDNSTEIEGTQNDVDGSRSMEGSGAIQGIYSCDVRSVDHESALIPDRL
jgi:2-(3-amino-3-carboxypropyl)histidine synthase